MQVSDWNYLEIWPADPPTFRLCLISFMCILRSILAKLISPCSSKAGGRENDQKRKFGRKPLPRVGQPGQGQPGQVSVSVSVKALLSSLSACRRPGSSPGPHDRRTTAPPQPHNLDSPSTSLSLFVSFSLSLLLSPYSAPSLTITTITIIFAIRHCYATQKYSPT